MRLLYVDDEVDAIEALLSEHEGGVHEVLAGPVCETTVGALVDLRMFADERTSSWVRTNGLLLPKAVPDAGMEAVASAVAGA